MKRREFLTTVGATSACAMTAATTGAAERDASAWEQGDKKYGVKISVIKRAWEKEIVEKMKTGPQGPCTRFKDGQEFTLTSHWAMPDNFCPWAYADIRTYIPMVMGQGNPIAVCCTDGYRPVFFKVERVEVS